MRFHVTKAEDSILKSDKWLLYKLGTCVAEDDLELLLLLPPLSELEWQVCGTMISIN